MAEHRVEKRPNVQEFNLSYLPNAHIYQRVIQGSCGTVAVPRASGAALSKD